ncbi:MULTISPECIES: PIN domain-containing protein [Leptolyngbya]|uniref:PIN domain-containing protein n=1 Tax=Leptolyngbya TaxID=47251 RepID=UPI0016835090|nr:PIN domain-containing protein [Leptolyngbya sp. FACHB-1624]
MSLKIVYLDSGILINGFRGLDQVGIRALQTLNNPAIQFASSEFVRLETLPKAIYHQRSEEAQFYETFFNAVTIWANDFDAIIQAGKQVARTYGLAGMDALHIAAAISVQAEEFITTERPTKPMHRVKELQITSVSS